jgi:hypothetical protein
MQLTTCPTCGSPAEIWDRFVLESTDGPVEHVAVRCALRHQYRMPSAMLDAAVHVQPKPSRRTTTRR